MVTTLTGQNSFLLHDALDQLVAAFVAEYTDMGLERFDGEDAEFDRMREALESLPFLVSKKMVVLRAPSANKQFVERAEKLLSDLPETTEVIIVEPKLDKRSSYYKYLQKNTDYKEFGELDDNGLARWLVDYAKTAGGTISQADARYLIDRIGVNQQLATNELDKLLLYDPKVSRQAIDLLVESTPQSTIFDLMDAAFSGKLAQAMELYTEQRAAKVEPQQIIAMMAWQLHVLAVIKMAGDRDPTLVAKEARLNPFVVRKSGAIVRRLSTQKLKELVHGALVLDTRLKSESLDADDALQHYLIQLAT
jgi:DNA polymerase-3 subunit delta